ncbi:MAG: YebC/PmpR family DNA-binding transcriptional regulator, partial [Kangiella sp.]|nr:YebC/PmpR family DNA-binding transcriptional regulator [Kangiella sp.]
GEVRHAFTKHGGNLGTNGSVAYLFEKKGQFIFGDNVEEEALMEAALEAGAEDFVAHDDGSFELQTTPEDFLDIKEALVKAGFEPESAEVSMLPSTQAELDVNDGAKVIRLVDRLEELDDTQNVYTNADIPSESYDLV